MLRQESKASGGRKPNETITSFERSELGPLSSASDGPTRLKSVAGVRGLMNPPEASRSGQALLEFAFLIPLLIIIIGATLSFGLFFYQANTLQQAVDVAAQEISRMPFKPTGVLGLGDLDSDTDPDCVLMYNPDFLEQVYDEKYLVVHNTEWNEDTEFNCDFWKYVDTWPLLNRLLAPMMIRDETYPDEDDDETDNKPIGVYRYPGAIVCNTVTGEETVLIPLVKYDGTGETLCKWVAPVEEIRPCDEQGPYSVTAMNSAASFVPGIVALRINYPAQSTTLANRTGDRGEQITLVGPVSSGADAPSTGSNYKLIDRDEDGGGGTAIHSGTYGLGKQASFFIENGVRPYRKVMSVQAIYRREVFE